MKKTFLLESPDIQKIRKTIRLLEKTVVEIIHLTEIARPKMDPFAPAQSDLTEETHFVQEQLELLRWHQEHSDSYDDDPVKF